MILYLSILYYKLSYDKLLKARKAKEKRDAALDATRKKFKQGPVISHLDTELNFADIFDVTNTSYFFNFQTWKSEKKMSKMTTQKKLWKQRNCTIM